MTNCIVIKEKIAVDTKALSIMLVLLGVLFGYKKVKKKKLSPIMLIVVSAIVGIGVGAIGG